MEKPMSFCDANQEDIDAYNKAHTPSTISKILYQKWVALYLNRTKARAQWSSSNMHQ